MSEKRTITVEVDLPMHQRPPQNEYEELSWAALDTAWNLLREYAVRGVLLQLREEAAEQGIAFPSDEQLFEQEPDNPDFPRSYLDLAASPDSAGRALDAAFQLLVAETFAEATEGLREAQAEAAE